MADPHGVGGRAWWLAMLWVGIGVAASGFIFLSSMQPVTVTNVAGIPAWLGGSTSANLIATAGMVAICAWIVLTVPVLLAGAARRRPAEQLLWAGAWVVGALLMVLTRLLWGYNVPERMACDHADGCGVVPYYGPAVVNWAELGICAAFLTLAVVMTRTAMRPASRLNRR
jgi:hypothetical protein